MYFKLINFSRYVFLFYIGYFLLQGFLISLAEKNILKFNIKKGVFRQRITIFLFHITCFFILAFNPETKSLDINTVSIFIKSTIFIFLGNIVLIKFLRKSYPLIWNGIFFLMSIGIVMLFRLNQNLAEKQLNWFIIGLIVSLIIPVALNILRNLEIFKYLYLILGLGLLIATLVYGNESGGAKNWITIKNITFQPSELVKILFVFYLASSLSKHKVSVKNLILPTITSGIFILCLVLQVDLGSSLIFLITYLSMVYISTANNLVVFCGILFSTLCTKFAYNYFSHIKVRVAIWLNPWEDIQGKGYQIAQSLFAISSFGLFGSGLKQGLPTSIPVVEKDFIFSAICEEFGVLFGVGVILIFIMIFLYCVKISLYTNNRFLSLLSSGLTSLMCFQTFIILAGVTKLIPMTGVTLPFISYGGSSILISFSQIGILQWVHSKTVDKVR